MVVEDVEISSINIAVEWSSRKDKLYFKDNLFLWKSESKLVKSGVEDPTFDAKDRPFRG